MVDTFCNSSELSLVYDAMLPSPSLINLRDRMDIKSRLVVLAHSVAVTGVPT
jgi:hypothetical protein